MNNAKWNKAELDWLSSLLDERWGGCWQVLPHQDGGLTLRPKQSSPHSNSIRLSSLTLSAGSSDIPCGRWKIKSPWYTTGIDWLPTPGTNSVPENLVEFDHTGCLVHYNPLALTYWCLTRQEEINRQDLDSFERFPAQSSHALKYSYIMRPIVDEWLEILGQIVDSQWPNYRCAINRPSIELSHDVDLPGRYAFASLPRLLRRMAGDLLIRRDPLNFVKAPLAKLGSSRKISNLDPHNKFGWMMDLAERNNYKATYYFISGQTNPRFDADYELEHPAIRHLMRNIHKRGHEIGLHPSFNSFKDTNALRNESAHLRSICQQEEILQPTFGARMHFLRWSQPHTQRALVTAGITHDASLGYADHAGFRCGTCIDYQAFDPISRKPLPLRIKPLIAMEASVIEPSYMAMGLENEALQIFNELKQACKRVGGTFSLLWHNSSLVSAAERDLLQEILKS